MSVKTSTRYINIGGKGGRSYALRGIAMLAIVAIAALAYLWIGDPTPAARVAVALGLVLLGGALGVRYELRPLRLLPCSRACRSPSRILATTTGGEPDEHG